MLTSAASPKGTWQTIDRVGAGLRARVAIPARGLLAAASLSLALGLALPFGLAREHSSDSSAPRHDLVSHTGLSSLPLAAQGPISAALGAAVRVYRVRISETGLQASNPAQRLHARFDRSGVLVTSGKAHAGLSLRAVGYGTSLRRVEPVTPTARANRVTYAHARLSEWYRNGPLGLEQGFTIPHAPAVHPLGPLTLSLALSGNARAYLASGGQTLTLSRTGWPSLRYAGLTATDARGRTLHAWLALHGGRLLLRVNARGARYPLRIDPLLQQGAKLAGKGLFGWSVALSSDGNTALIGSTNDNSASVFTRSRSTWTQQGPKLTASDESGPGEFGTSVALSADGNAALIGGPGDNVGVGAAWVFTRSRSTWTQQGAKLTGSDESGQGEFGTSVALSSDGNTALIGAYDDAHGVSFDSALGAAWVFTRSGSTWIQQGAKLTGSVESLSGEFGWSVALSSDGNTALIGGPGDDATVVSEAEVTEKSNIVKGLVSTTGFVEGTQVTGAKIPEITFVHRVSGEHEVELTREAEGAGNATIKEQLTFFTTPKVGSAWVFTRAGSTWTQQGEKLTGAGEASGVVPGTGGYFGYSVALSADGNTALIGGPLDKVFAGAAWVFTRSGSTWVQQGAKLTGAGAIEEAGFGWGVALSADGNTALIGGPYDNEYIGAAWVFTRSGSTWTQQGGKLTGTGETTAHIGEGEGYFGHSVALSADGSTALIGGPYDTEQSGSAWVFASEAAPSNISPPVISGTTQIGHTLSCSTGSWTGNPAPTFAYQWLRDGAKITSATASYTVEKADAGHELVCEVTASNSAGKASGNSAAVKVPTESAPKNIEVPNIFGEPTVGISLSCSTGSWTGNAAPTFAYQWQRDGSNIGGANAATYVVQAADQGHTLTCVVTGSNEAGHQTASSSGMAIPSPPSPPAPSSLSSAPPSPPLTTAQQGVKAHKTCKKPGKKHAACKRAAHKKKTKKHKHH